MDRDVSRDIDKNERLDADLTAPDPSDVEDDTTDRDRRKTVSAIVDSVEPARKPRGSDEAVYADTDLNPNAEDQRDEHTATIDDVV